MTVQEEESNVGQSPIPETTKKLYQEALKILPKIPKKNSTGTTTTSTTSPTTSKLDPDLSFKDILEEDVDVPGTSGSKSSKDAACGDENAVGRDLFGVGSGASSSGGRCVLRAMDSTDRF